MANRFETLQKKIIERSKHDPAGSAEKGDKREALVGKVLKKLKEEKKIIAFMKATKFGLADIAEGIDFYIVIMRKKRIVVPIQVTGPYFAEEHKAKHPKIPVISVEKEDEGEIDRIRKQIEKIIEKY